MLNEVHYVINARSTPQATKPYKMQLESLLEINAFMKIVIMK